MDPNLDSLLLKAHSLTTLLSAVSPKAFDIALIFTFHFDVSPSRPGINGCLEFSPMNHAQLLVHSQ